MAPPLSVIKIVKYCDVVGGGRNKARFIHTSTVTILHSCSRKKYAYALRAYCFYIKINIFEHF